MQVRESGARDSIQPLHMHMRILHTYTPLSTSTQDFHGLPKYPAALPMAVPKVLALAPALTATLGALPEGLPNLQVNFEGYAITSNG